MQLEAFTSHPLNHVLLVDPAGDSRRPLVDPFERFGYHVSEAETGELALSRFEQMPAGVVVTELSVPGVDGVELARQIRTRPFGRESTIIAVTTLPPGSPERDEAREAGCDLILSKPYLPWIVVSRADALRKHSKELRTQSRRMQERADQLGVKAAQVRGHAREIIRHSEERLVNFGNVGIANRIRSEFLDMPGLRLDIDYVAQFFGVDIIRAERALMQLVRVGFLDYSDGVFHRR